MTVISHYFATFLLIRIVLVFTIPWAGISPEQGLEYLTENLNYTRPNVKQTQTNGGSFFLVFLYLKI